MIKNHDLRMSEVLHFLSLSHFDRIADTEMITEDTETQGSLTSLSPKDVLSTGYSSRYTAGWCPGDSTCNMRNFQQPRHLSSVNSNSSGGNSICQPKPRIHLAFC